MATSSTKWTINPGTFGMTLERLVTARLPEWIAFVSGIDATLPRPAGYTGSVDDFSPDLDYDGEGVLRIVPYSELDSVVQDGDVVIFMEGSAGFDPSKPTDPSMLLSLLKQRGSHAEIVFHNSEGKAVQCAPWDNTSEIVEYRCCDLGNHRRYCPSYWNLHIFRISARSGSDGQISRLLSGVHKWRSLFQHFSFPEGHHNFDPVDFWNVTDLADIARRLVRSERMEDVNCMQWVCTVLSLALNYPLSPRTLSELDVLDAYRDKWPHVGFVDEDIVPLGRLPIDPYSPCDLIVGACKLYLRMSDAEIQSALPRIKGASIFQSALQSAPMRTIPPIAPLMEYRKPAHTGKVQWEYVATAFNDRLCQLR